MFNQGVIALPAGISTPSLRQDFSDLNDEGTVVRSNVRISIPGTRFTQADVFGEKSTLEDVQAFINDTFRGLISTSLRSQNVSEINTLLEGVGIQAGNSFRVSVALDDKTVVSISDSELVLGVNENFLLNYGTLSLFQAKRDPQAEGEEISEVEAITIDSINSRIDASFEDAAEVLSAPNTAQLLASGSQLLRTISRVGNKKLHTLLREAIGQSSSWLERSRKDIVVKFDQDDVFGAIARENGEIKVLLSPVDIHTGAPVENVDILAGLV